MVYVKERLRDTQCHHDPVIFMVHKKSCISGLATENPSAISETPISASHRVKKRTQQKKIEKIALINPGKNKPWASIHPPMNLAQLAAVLENENYEVAIFDELAGQDVRYLMETWKPDMVGITGTTPLITDAYRIADEARQRGIHTVMGGVHVSVVPEEGLLHADQVVVGEGEKAILEIVRGNTDRIIQSDIVKDLNTLPTPSWHLLDMQFYLTTRHRLPDTHLRIFNPESRIASIMVARGCPFSCVFCNNSWQKYPMRFIAPEAVVNQIEHLIQTYGANAIYFAEDDFLANKRRAREICRLIIERKLNISFSCQVRAKAADFELFNVLKEAGCVQIQFGLETGSQRMLNYLKKNTTTIEENERAISLCRAAGIEPFGTFMIGCPTETEEDIEMTRAFIRRNNMQEAGILILYPYPGTEIWAWCDENNLLPENIDWSIYTTEKVPILANTTLTRDRLDEIYLDMLHEFRYLNKLSSEAVL